MQVVPQETFPLQDRAGLGAFLAYVHTQAQTRGQELVASISLKVSHIAPLAVLESIYNPHAAHAYFERPQVEESLMGAEAVCEGAFSGAGRFAQAKAFAQEVLSRCVSGGDVHAPFAGPQFFAQFDFEDSVTSGEATARVFLSRFQVARAQGQYVAVANVLVSPHDCVETQLEKIWAAYSRFLAYDYQQDKGTGTSHTPTPTQPAAPLPPMAYQRWVKKAVEAIDAGPLEKVVLAQARDIPFAQGRTTLFSCLSKLRSRYEGCVTYSWGQGQGRAFIGATPERLCLLKNGRLYTEALAGSAARGNSPAQDAKLANTLLHSDKDLREHAYVRGSIVEALAGLGLSVEAPAQPRLRSLANVQHLLTPIEAPVPEGVHVLDIAAALHPTPAVGGYPREAALEFIRTVEPFERRAYAGCMGVFDAQGEGKFIVALRCAQMQPTFARLFAGAGIVAGSQAEAEEAETEVKFGALSSLFK